MTKCSFMLNNKAAASNVLDTAALLIVCQCAPQVPAAARQSSFLFVSPRRWIISISSAIVVPDVVSIFPVMDADAPALSAVAPFSGRSFRPAARRIFAVGLMKRKMAIVRRMSSGGRLSRPSMPVPGIGIKEFTGIDSMPSSERLIAMSMRSSHVSPMPMMPPEQTQKPSSCAILIVLMRSS